jgi:hypothetical protein
MTTEKRLIKQGSKGPYIGAKPPYTSVHEQNQRVSTEHGVNKPNAGKWVAGTSGNPAGRPLGSRQKIAETLLQDLAEVWAKRGKSVLERMAIDDPGKLASIAYGLLPRDIFVTVEQRTPAGMDADDWERMLGLARTMREIAPDASLEDIELALRSAFAKPVSG